MQSFLMSILVVDTEQISETLAFTSTLTQLMALDCFNMYYSKLHSSHTPVQALPHSVQSSVL